MKTFWRIIGEADLSWRMVGLFILSTLLYVGFNLINFSALIPLLEVLFNEVSSFQNNTDDAWFYGLKYRFYNFLEQQIEARGKMSALVIICAIVLISVIMANLFRYVADMCLVYLRLRVIEKMREDLFAKLIDLPLTAINSMKKGDVTARVMNDVQEVETSVAYTLKVYLKEPILIIGYLSILVAISPYLSLYTIVLIPISGLIIAFISRRLKRRALETQRVLGEMGFVLDQILTGLREIKSFNAQDYMMRWISGKNKEYSDFSRKMGARFQLAGPISEVLGILTMVVILLIGGRMVLDEGNQLTASQFIAFLIIFSQVLAPAKALSQAHSLMQRGIAGANRVYELIDRDEVEVVNETEVRKLLDFKESIEIRGVSFSYGGADILRDVNCRIEKGKIYALSGSSGSGKSTLADLILRFHDPKAGKILVDGIDISEFDPREFRKLVGVVSQDTMLFNDTLRNNLTLGGSVSDERLKEVLGIACADDFVERFEDGLETVVGERGLRLSGGERQRIAIARAVIRDAPILILDEATSSLDREAAEKVIVGLKRLMAGRTTIMISHQRDLVCAADEVLVLEEGRMNTRTSG